MRLISPNELHQAAKDTYLGGNDPVTQEDWVFVVNFWAVNVASGVEVAVCKLLAKIYDCPLPDKAIEHIAAGQASIKAIKRSAV